MSYDKLIFDISKTGKKGYTLPKWEDTTYSSSVDAKITRNEEILLPEVTENELVRHYTQLSKLNYSIDLGFYPLGSCTMKYNPKINEVTASLEGFTNIHPYQDEEDIQGALELMYELSNTIAELTGMHTVTLQPSAGSHGEYTGLLAIKAYHKANNDTKRTKIIVPDSAHGTNPASARSAGFEVVEVASNDDGCVDLDCLKEVLGDDTAGIMLTNPNTLGIFEKDIEEIARLVHDAGGLLYYDGANMNAIMGITRPSDMGFDVIHLNTHKTFSTPHGGGGPGAGPIGVSKRLSPYLPIPLVEKHGDKYKLNYDLKTSIGSIKGFYGNFGVLIRAYTYMLIMGRDGLKRVSKMAVLSANYLQARLKKHFKLPKDTVCKHEFVIDASRENVRTLDVAKRLIDYGFHPPTIYFPLIINEAMMIEPTETESLDTLDAFADAMIKISKEEPSLLKEAPYNSPVRRPDEVVAAKKPILSYFDE